MLAHDHMEGLMSSPHDRSLCPPAVHPCGACGEDHTYYCGRSVLYRNPAKKEEACPGALQICGSCVEDFQNFMKRAYDAQAVRQEWGEG